MLSLNSTTTIVRPAFFIVKGFSEIPHAKYYYFFLFFCYAFAVMGNLFLMTIICFDRKLHTPKYLAIFNLAVCDLGESTALIPNLVETFIFITQKISYEACLANMFFVLLFFCMQSLILTALAYDRFIAICFPLRYHSIVTNTSMAIIIMTMWLFELIIITTVVSSIIKVSFCGSVVIDSYFCNFGPVLDLACSNFVLQAVLMIISMVINYFVTLAFIGLSYVCILFSVFKIATWAERIKALKTCLSHFISVIVFFVPLISIDMAVAAKYYDLNTRVIGISLSSTIPPVLNPVVYSLSTAEIRDFLKKMFQRKNHKGISSAVSN